MLVCAACFRHVRSLPCPFCGGTTSRGGELPGPSAIRVGMRRGVLLLGLTGAAVQGCGGDIVTAMDAYGIPPDGLVTPDADATATPDVTPDADVVSFGDVYGIPPDAFVVTDAAVYGIPPDGR